MEVTPDHISIAYREKRNHGWSVPTDLDAPAAVWFYLQDKPTTEGAQILLRRKDGTTDVATMQDGRWIPGDIF